MHLSIATTTALSLPTAAIAENALAAVRKPIHIPAEALSIALQTLAQEHGFQVAYISQDVDSRYTHGASGELTVDEALVQILAGTGLTFRHSGESAISIVPIKSAGADEPEKSKPSKKEFGGADGDTLKSSAPCTNADLDCGKASRGSVTLPGDAGRPSGSRWPGMLLSFLAAHLFAPATLAQDTAPSTATQDTSSASLQEIVVTAEKIAVDVMHAPVSVTAINGDTLKQNEVHTLEDLQFFVPGMTITADPGTPTLINIRGIGALTNQPSANAGVPTYHDGALMRGSGEPLWDVANVQVLRGPQGTLVGASSTGGAMFISTVNPTLGDSSGYAQAEGGDYHHMRVEAAMNLPISSTLAARIGTYIERRDSWSRNLTPVTFLENGGIGPYTTRNEPGDLNTDAARATLLWQPNDRVQVVAKLDYFQSRTGGPAVKPQAVFSTQVAGVTTVCPAPGSYFNADASTWGNVPGFCGNAPFAPADPYQIGYSGVNNTANENLWRESVEAKLQPFETGPSLRLLAANAYDHAASVGDTGNSGGSRNFNGGSVNDNHERARTFEADVISPQNQPLQWVVGGFYYQDYQGPLFFQQAFYSGGPIGNCAACSQLRGGFYFSGAAASAEHALFANVNYTFNSQWKVEGGIRKTWHQDYNPWIPCQPTDVATPTCMLGDANGHWGLMVDPNDSGSLIWNGQGNLGQQNTGESRDAPLTWKLALDYNLTPQSYLYAEVATGSKAGGINAPPGQFGPDALLFLPEKDTDFEIGWKATLLDGHATVQTNAFYTRYANLQVTGTSPVFGGNWIYNAEAASVYGLEFAGAANLGGWELNASANYTKSSYSLSGVINGDACTLNSFCNNVNSGQCQPGQPDGGLGTIVGNDGTYNGCFNFNQPGPYIDGQQSPWLTNFRNKQLPFSPTFQGSIELGYRIALGEAGLTPRVTYSYMNSQQVAAFGSPLDFSPARTDVGAKLVYDYQRWIVEAFATNLSNQTYPLSLSPGGVERYNAPGEWGVRVTKSW
jgi:iron complex outermembrane receptor protein